MKYQACVHVHEHGKNTAAYDSIMHFEKNVNFKVPVIIEKYITFYPQKLEHSTCTVKKEALRRKCFKDCVFLLGITLSAWTYSQDHRLK